MAKKVQHAFVGDGYRFVDPSGIITAVLDPDGRFTLKDGNSSLEVFDSWAVFVSKMGETPVTAAAGAKLEDALIVAQLESLGLGKAQQIDRGEGGGRVAPVEETKVAEKKAAVEKLKGTKKPAKAAAAKKPKVEKVAAPCHCGCGGMASSKLGFLMGHDARVHGWAKKVQRGDLKIADIPTKNLDVLKKWFKEHDVTQGKKEAA